MNRYKIFLKSGETVEVEAEKVMFVIDQSGHVYRYDFVEANLKGMLKPKAVIYNNMIYGWIELHESDESKLTRERLSLIKNMCDKNPTCDDCIFDHGNCYFHDVIPSSWNIDEIIKILEVAESEG